MFFREAEAGWQVGWAGSQGAFMTRGRMAVGWAGSQGTTEGGLWPTEGVKLYIYINIYIYIYIYKSF